MKSNLLILFTIIGTLFLTSACAKENSKLKPSTVTTTATNTTNTTANTTNTNSTKTTSTSVTTATAVKDSNTALKFKAMSITNKEITNEIFKNKKLTMINVWATYCRPCINEMPELEKLYEEMKTQNVNIIGIISDTPDKNNETLAKDIIKKAGVKYDNLISNDALKKDLINDINAVPTSIFVDSNGNIVGSPLIGSRGKDSYKSEIQKILKTIK